MLSPSCHQCLEARGTTGPEVTRVGGLSLAPTNSGEQALSYLDNIIGPTLLAEVWASQP